MREFADGYEAKLKAAILAHDPYELPSDLPTLPKRSIAIRAMHPDGEDIAGKVFINGYSIVREDNDPDVRGVSVRYSYPADDPDAHDMAITVPGTYGALLTGRPQSVCGQSLLKVQFAAVTTE